MYKQGLIIHIAAEVAPFSKRGGLGDVVGSLPLYLNQESGWKNLIFTPYYSKLTDDLIPVYQGEVDFNGINYEYIVLESNNSKVNYYFIKFEDAYFKDDAYEDGSQPYDSVVELFYFIFGKSIIYYLNHLQVNVGAILTHDWHAAGIYPYLPKLMRFTGDVVKTIHVIHNYQHQGEILFDITEYLEPEVITYLERQYRETGYCTMSSLAVLEAEQVITVSPTYAFELAAKTAPHPGLELLSYRQNQIQGILNGIDDTIWNPGFDVYLVQPYDIHTIERKQLNKQFLLKRLRFSSLNLPLVVFISRLTIQKGVDLFVDLNTGRSFNIYSRLESILAKGMLLVICGVPNGGTSGIINLQFNALQNRFPDRFRYINQYTEEIAHQLLAGGDILIQPSRFEPCGLIQMYALKYGTVPIVTPVGGLKDTIRDYNFSLQEGTGFLMKNCSFPALCEAFDRALHVFQNPIQWNELMKDCMLEDNSWSQRIPAYIELINS